MSTLSGTTLPVPTDWAPFERATKVLFECVLDDPNTQMHGRQGQPQNGVDIWGTRRKNQKLVGIQCKRFDEVLSAKALEDEVRKAHSFVPPIDEFVLATTAPRDAKIQKAAREITQKLKKTARPITVSVWGWQDISEAAARYGEAWDAFDPTYNGHSKKTFLRIEQSETNIIEHIDRRFAKLALDQSAHANTAAPIAADSTENTPLHGKITAFVSLATSGNAEVAHSSLIELREKEWASAQSSERYRLLIALGVAQLARGNEQEAGQFLADAYRECPGHKNAAVNRLKGLLLARRVDEALPIARSLMADQPASAEVAGLYIQASAVATLEPDPPLADLHESVHQSKEVQTARIEFLRKRGNPAWITVAREAAATNDDALIQAFNADGILERVIARNPGIVLGAPLPFPDHEELEAAAKTLSGIALDKNVASTFAAPSANNAALALRLLRRTDEAKFLLDRVIQKFPKAEPPRVQRASIALTEGQADQALALLPAGDADPEVATLRVDCLVELRKWSEALALLDRIDDRACVDSHLRLVRTSSRLAIYLAIAPEKAVPFLESLLAADPADLNLRALHVHALRRTGHDAEARQALGSSIPLITDEAPYGARVQLAAEANEFGRYGDVLRLLKGHLVFSRPSKPLELACAAALNGSFPREAKQLLQSLSPELKRIPFYLRFAAALALNTGDPATEQLVNEYLTLCPDDLHFTVRKCALLLLSGRESELGIYLATIDVDRLKGPPHLRLKLCQAIARYHSVTEGMRLAYATLMHHWDDASVHLAYSALLFLNEVAEALPESNEVQPGYVVTVSESHGSLHKYRIESATYPTFADERLAPSSELASLLVGKKVGDRVEISGAPTGRVLQIDSIKHVYLDALHVSLNAFNVRFPNHSGLMAIRMDPDKPLADIEEITRLQQDVIDEQLAEYEKHTLPLAFTSALLGHSSLTGWASLLELRRKVKTCIGTAVERTEAFAVIRGRAPSGFVADAVTAQLIMRLGVKAALENVLGPAHTTQSVNDLFGARAVEAEDSVRREQKGSFVWIEGKLQIRRYSQEALLEWARRAKDDHSWILSNYLIAAAAPKADLIGDAKKVIALLPKEVTDPAIAAYGNDLLLLSDDLGYRRWAASSFAVATAWLQPCLMIARDRGFLTSEQYATAVGRLVQHGEHYVSLDAKTLSHLAENATYTLSSELRECLMILGEAQANLSDNIPLTAVFLTMALAKGTPFHFKTMLSVASESFARGRASQELDIVIELFRSMAASSPPWVRDYVLGPVRAHVHDWLRGHSFGSLYSQRFG